MNVRFGILFLLLSSAMSCIAMRKAQENTPHYSLEINTPFTAEPAHFLQSKYFAYEIEIKNLAKTPFLLDELTIYDADTKTLIKNYDAKTLNFVYLDQENNPVASSSLPPAGRALIYVWLSFPLTKTMPAKLDHQIKGSFGSKPIVLNGNRVEIPRKAPIIIGSPFKHKNIWYAANGPAPNSAHRQAITPVAGPIFMPQRFAIDWMVVGAKNRAFKHEGDHNSDWYSYGQELVAVADGTIRHSKNDISDNPVNSRAVDINLDTALGNYVTLEIDDKHLAVYAHLMPGSVQVRVGDKVKKGQVLGRIGNSGNSDAPHLHLHICEGPHPLLSQGQSYSFEHFDFLGMSTSIDGLISGGNVMSSFLYKPQAANLSYQLMLDNAVLQF